MQHAHTTAPIQLTESALRALALSGLHQEPLIDGRHDPDRAKLGSPSDFDLNPELAAQRLKQPAPRPAAVLVPIVSRSELTVLLTQRTKDLPSHAGQIAFPGGKMEAGDNGPVATALRETQEEIGLEARFVEPIGYLDPYLTGTGFCVFPVVALVREGFHLSPDASEVAEVFEVPLAFFMDTQNHKTHERAWHGGMRRFHAMPFQDRYIWGVTAGIMKNMHQRLFAT
jgi:8-oxo-dGTP pyrophosphatase MutT (NUDIX family)